MAKHPGGQDILLGVLGRDATVEFETMRHSQIALKQSRGKGRTAGRTMGKFGGCG